MTGRDGILKAIQPSKICKDIKNRLTILVDIYVFRVRYKYIYTKVFFHNRDI